MKIPKSQPFKLSFTVSILIIFLVSSGCNKKEKIPLCHQHKEYFEGKTTLLTAKDSADAELYDKRLFELYSNFNKIHYQYGYAYQLGYEMKYYDTALLFSTLNLYINDKKEYDKYINLPISLVTELIKNDAVIKGEVVNKINDFKECRYFTTTYFIKVQSVIHSYFPLNVGDTVLIHFPFFGMTGYCEPNKKLSFTAINHVMDYITGEKDLHILLNRKSYLRAYENLINTDTVSFPKLRPFEIRLYKPLRARVEK